MLIVMQNTASELEIEAVCAVIKQLGFEAHKMPGAQRTAVCVTGNDGSVSERHFSGLTGIRQIIRVSKPYKLTSNETKTKPTVVTVNGVSFGEGKPGIIAGPACVETGEATLRIAEQLAQMGIKLFHASAYRPRNNPYLAQGVGEMALPVLAEIKQRFGLGIVTEVVDVATVDAIAEVADILVVDSYNMHNFALLRKLSKRQKPVILKRAPSAGIEEFLMSAEYILAGGNQQVILCDAGMRSFGDHSAYALDITFVPALRKLTHLPIIVDPSQASGTADRVPALTRAVLALGVDGVMIECHDQPATSSTGGAQAITPEVLKTLIHLKK